MKGCWSTLPKYKSLINLIEIYQEFQAKQYIEPCRIFLADFVDAFNPNHNVDNFQICLMDLIYFSSKDFFQLKMFIIQTTFGLEKCSLHENGVEFHQKLIGNVFRGITRQKCV